MWIFGHAPWTDADQTFMIHTSLLTGRGHGNGIAVLAWPPRKLSPPLLSLSLAWTQDVEWAKYRSNNACVVVLECAAAPYHHLAVYPCLSIYDGLWDNYRRSALFVCSVCAGEQRACWDMHWCTIPYDLWAMRCHKVDESVIDIA